MPRGSETNRRALQHFPSALAKEARRAPAPRIRRIPAARVSVAVGFMLSGIAFASWVVRIPDVQARLQLTEGSLARVEDGFMVIDIWHPRAPIRQIRRQ